MRKILCYFISCLTVIFSINAYSEDMDGNKLLKTCTDLIFITENNEYSVANGENFTSQAFSSAECFGYLEAAHDMNINSQFIQKLNAIARSPYYCARFSPLEFQKIYFKLFSPIPVSCPPPNVTYLQVAKIIVKYLNEHPEKLNEQGVDIINDIMSKTFPC